MYNKHNIPSFLTSNIYIGLWLTKAFTLTQLQSYELFRNNKSVGVWGTLSFPLLRDAIPPQLVRGITPKEGVPQPIQSMVRCPPSHLRSTILAWQILLNVWLPTCSLHHQQNVKWFRSHNSTTQQVWTATPILPESPRSSRTGWMQNNMLLRCSESNVRCFSTLLK